MKKFLVSLLLSISLLTPTSAGCEEKKPFLAVFASKDLKAKGLDKDWDAFHPDILFYTQDWDDFDNFVDNVRDCAGDREIVIDLDLHGDDQLLLYNETMEKEDQGNLGEVVSILEKKLDEDRLTLTLEACFSPNVYRNTIRRGCSHIPKFPIYGVCGNHYGFSNIVFMQYYYHIYECFSDLRMYENSTVELEKKDFNFDSRENVEAIALMWYLRSLSENS